ncbi:NifX-associated nitrogen fixation protein [Ensifer sesbaniae]|uniref:NifX-associated nitrogen fixation protein n=1 Tax=Ensifer sesbaniae TaxID=1214071 RepID=UPI0015690644|nr:NifX-associated nitrogen fixation protein [Ensifer sesbaniae]NRQ19209.1 hypothetical protein [Ensifer sesbaniae]
MTTLPNPAVIPVLDHDKVVTAPFIRCLVRLIRAQDAYGSWKEKCDFDVLDHFTVADEKRCALPLMGDPDPDVLWRLDVFYQAVGVAIEERSGLLVSRTMEINNEGFGRVLFTTRRLVLLSKTLRDVHRFGFSSLRKLATTGAKLVNDAARVIEAYPDVARA